MTHVPHPPATAAPPGVAVAVSAPASGGPDRFDRLDAWRGLAIVWMAAFHLCFDLNHYGFFSPVQVFWRDPFWTLQRTCIVSLFLLGAGAGQAVALAGGQTWGRFWRRWAQVAGCALAVSAGSALMFPPSWISFGVLHGMAVMLLLLRAGGGASGLAASGGPASVRLGTRAWLLRAAAALALAGLAMWLPRQGGWPMFDNRLGNWTGLVTRLPLTEDYVPVLPWAGVMLAGFVSMSALLRWRRAWVTAGVPAVMRPLAVLGRWSLSFYMVHQPVLIGLVLVARMCRTMQG